MPVQREGQDTGQKSHGAGGGGDVPYAPVSTVMAKLELPPPAPEVGVWKMTTSFLPHILIYVSTCHFLKSQHYKGKIIKEKGHGEQSGD